MTARGAAGRIWSDDEVNTLKRMSQTHSYSLIAQKIGVSRDAVAKKYGELAKIGVVRKRSKADNDLQVSERNDALITLPPKYLDMMRANVEKALIISDIHLPCIDWELFELLLKVAKRQGVRTCVVGGDLFDLALFSRFADANAHGPEELTMGQQAAIKFFSMLLDQFEKVYVICGNHDFRIFNFTGGKITEHLFFNFMTNLRGEKRVEFSSYRHMVLNDKTRVVHPNGGGNFAIEGVRECVKYQQNIIMTHGHRMGRIYDPSGRWESIGSGAVLDPTTQAYVMTVPSGTPMWNTGGVIMAGDLFYLFPKYKTDWDLWTSRRFL